MNCSFYLWNKIRILGGASSTSSVSVTSQLATDAQNVMLIFLDKLLMGPFHSIHAVKFQIDSKAIHNNRVSFSENLRQVNPVIEDGLYLQDISNMSESVTLSNLFSTLHLTGNKLLTALQSNTNVGT